jgi:hypothetical protein
VSIYFKFLSVHFAYRLPSSKVLKEAAVKKEGGEERMTRSKVRMRQRRNTEET